MPRFHREVALPASAEDVYDWHLRPGAFQRLTPPWEKVAVVDPGNGVAEGSRVRIRVPLAGPISNIWIAEHRDLIPGRQFRDIQLTGPFARWEHTHRIRPDGASSILEDDIEYDLPLGALGALLGGGHVRGQLARMFDYRHAVMRIDTARHARGGSRRMRVLVTGASGLVGRVLTAFLTTGGHAVTCLGRGSSRLPGTESRTWNPDAGVLDPAVVDGFDAVVHLAGENIAGGRWSASRKQRIRDSRVGGTKLLADALAKVPRPPEVFVSASALGYYGDRGETPLPEDAPPGTGFLPEVCVEWERATEPARARGIRTVMPRIGLVLTPAGGALASMLPPFQCGVGGPLGSGRQYMSWITVDDLVGVIHCALITPTLSGPVNAVSPSPVTNLEFTKTLGRVLRRPTLLAVPRLAARVLLGEMSDALLFASTRVVPEKLLASGFEFAHPNLEEGLRHVLGR
jgi:uncharacterized protein (TIGR01777 family)